MPIIQITYSTPAPSVDLPARIAKDIVAITTRVLRKKPELTAVTIAQRDAAHWFVGGPSLAEQGLASFFLDIKVVDGTNTKDEKAAYVATIFDAFGQLLGPVHPESYVYIHDVKAEAYGFGGLTQEHRYIAGRLPHAA
ncbi:4-oxalocrotonate tautomerase [Phreatobacter aquaticus]|uniref:4-oxalocrotonate tautomerase n=1 Tax=Phreatobacter aquaticus TaxID=2570229 RepID=A0A4D7QFF6_9HYPH|nr:tautomerase family protein [Phreatobacter aquaticus]QCK84403.1 4-oxalocrotonate tautomerase [Phreatobacter aquaticus]